MDKTAKRYRQIHRYGGLVSSVNGILEKKNGLKSTWKNEKTRKRIENESQDKQKKGNNKDQRRKQ